MSTCLSEFVGQHGGLVITVSLTLAALGFSIFGSVFSNLVHTAEMAEGNALQSNVISQAYWRKASRHLRGLARSRAYSANLCCWSLGSIIITLMLFLTSPPGIYLVIFFLISVLFLIIASITAIRALPKLLQRIFLLCPINPGVPRFTEDC